MKCLVLRPTRRSLAYSCFDMGSRAPNFTATIEDYRGPGNERVGVIDRLRRTRNAWQKEMKTTEPDVIAVRSTFGGEAFAGPTLLDADVIERLETLVPFAPLHLPSLIQILDGFGEVYPGVPVVVVFETSFFTALPQRETYYGLDPSLTSILGLRRFGYHGLYHEAACGEARSALRARGGSGSPRLISICMEPRPEVAAVIGQRPVMVTSGVTALEGLPGQRTCGELDPSIVLTLREDLGWGPEKINEVLTQESGINGLLNGHSCDLDTLFTPNADRAPGHAAGNVAHEELDLARDIMRYRILLACGSAVAAMGGIDAIVFSGRHAKLADVLGPYLSERLKPRIPANAPEIPWFQNPAALDRLIADHATAVAVRTSAVGANGTTG